jgi:hypothetical protein
MLVEPGTELAIIVGAGGGPGMGGANPTPGGDGGQTAILWNGKTIVNANGGSGGGAATSSANGSGGPGGAGGVLVMQSIIGSIPVFILDVYTLAGNDGGVANPQTLGSVPTLAPGMNNSQNAVAYGYGGAPGYSTYGNGGYGGNVGENGQPGNPGVVLIWWGDD